MEKEDIDDTNLRTETKRIHNKMTFIYRKQCVRKSQCYVAICISNTMRSTHMATVAPIKRKNKRNKKLYTHMFVHRTNEVHKKETEKE